MDISYKDSNIQKTCENHKTASKKLGDQSAKKLNLRLQQIEATQNVAALVLGNPHPLKGDRNLQFALDLHGGHRLVFSPNHDPIPHKNENEIDWSLVTKIIIIFIGDYHD